jgi:hypothetical protein
MLGMAKEYLLNFDSLGFTLNRIEGFFSEIFGSAIAGRIMFLAPASPALPVTRGGIAQERALTSVPASLGVLSRDFSEAFPEIGAGLGISTRNTSAANVFSEAFSETRSDWASNLGLPGLLISCDSVEEFLSEDTDGGDD